MRDETELGDRRRVQHERVEIVQPHAAIDRVDRKCQRHPRLDKLLRVGVARMKIEDRSGPLRQPRVHREAEHVRGFERVDDVKVVREAFGEILPRVRARVGGNETLAPIRRRSLRIVILHACA